MKCIEDEIPFEVPEGWSWCRFSTITVNKDAERKPISLAKRQDVKKIYDYYGASGKIDKIDKYIFDEKLLLIGEDGANLTTRSKPIAFLVEGKYWVNNHAHCIDATNKFILDYLCVYINTISLEKYVTGSAQPKMTQANMNSILVPLPPYKEQCQINLQLSNVFGILNHIENWKTDIVELITETKSKILDLAIRGKLVPQDPNDEPASALLERIRAEKEELIKQGKIKRDKKASIIFRGNDNSYYEKFVDGSIININNEICIDLPDGWIWLRGRNCFTGVENRKPDGEFFDYIDIDSVNNKNNAISNPKHILCSEAPSRASRAVFDGSIVFSLVRPYLKNIAYIDESLAHCIASTGFYVCTSNGILYSKYMFLLLISDYTIQGLNQYMKGDNSPSIRKDDIENWLFPIPPYNEQIRIVQQWGNYNAKFSKIEASLIQD